MSVWSFVSDFGNFFVGGVTAGVVFAWMWSQLGRTLAVVFAVCFACGSAAVLGLKLVADAVAPPLHQASMLQFSTGAPSGHAAVATIVYGSIAATILSVDRRPAALLGVLACILMIGVVCVTRVTLNKHTIADVLAGFLLAGLDVAAFALALKRRPVGRPIPTTGLLLMATAAAALALASGVRLNSDQFI